MSRHTRSQGVLGLVAGGIALAAAAAEPMLLAIGVDHDPTKIEWQGGYEDAYVKTEKGWRMATRWHVWIDMENSIQYKSMIAAGIRFPIAAPAAPAAAPK